MLINQRLTKNDFPVYRALLNTRNVSKNPDIFICEIIESKMYEILDKINQTDSIIEADPLHSELRILDWVLFQVCSNEIKWLSDNN